MQRRVNTTDAKNPFNKLQSDGTPNLKTQDKVTYVVFILDESGSMDSCRKQAVDDYNEQLQTFRKADHKILMTYVPFSSRNNVKLEYVNQPIDEIRDMKLEDYNPDGSTALYDAVNLGIDELEKVKLNKQDAVFFIVITDGYENNSTAKSKEEVPGKIKRLEGTGQWTFTFLGANIDVRAVAKSFNIDASNSLSFESTGEGYEKMRLWKVGANKSYLAARSMGHTQVKNLYGTSDPNAQA
jgi:Mg-chelatase subunit ChlD